MQTIERMKFTKDGIKAIDEPGKPLPPKALKALTRQTQVGHPGGPLHSKVIVLPPAPEPKREPARVDTRHQKPVQPTRQPLRVDTRPAHPLKTKPTDDPLRGRGNQFNRVEIASLPKLCEPKPPLDLAPRWIDGHVASANSKARPPVPAGKRSYQAGPFHTDNRSLQLSLPPSTLQNQQALHAAFLAAHGDLLTVLHASYDAACQAADEAAKLFSALVPKRSPDDLTSLLDEDDEDERDY